MTIRARRLTARDFADKVPYAIAIVELEEGPHVANERGGLRSRDAPHRSTPGGAFEDVSEVISLVHFRPVDT